MSIAKHPHIQNSRLINLSQIQRILWYLHAYGAVLGVLGLSCVSLIFLSIHWTYRKLFSNRRIIETNEWDLNSIN
jgi:hypothetical protein